MKHFLFITLVGLYISTTYAIDLPTSPSSKKGIIHQDTASRSFKLMVQPIEKMATEFFLTNKELKETKIDLSNIYSVRLFHINDTDIQLSISFCHIQETGNEVWSTPSQLNIKNSKGEYSEYSLANLNNNINVNLASISKIKIEISKKGYIDEINLQYFKPEKNIKKPDMKKMKKKLKHEKQRFKDKKTKEFNTIREAEYKDHF